MKLILILLILFPAEIQAHHWIGFISCGFVLRKDIEKSSEWSDVQTSIAPNFGRVFVRIDAISYVRGYRWDQVKMPGPSCSTIHLKGGTDIQVLGTLDNILKRLERKYQQGHK